MNHPNPSPAACLFFLLLGGAVLRAEDAADTAAPPVPLSRAHAHNDYAHARPLQDALDAGFCSVEADIYLVDGQLLVAHDRDKVSPQRTLQGLYLDPLRERAARNGGNIHPGTDTPAFHLLIDLKSDGETTYRALHAVLERYRDIFTEFTETGITRRAVTAIISGNRPKSLMAGQPVRYAGVDGRLSDLGKGDPATLMPWISDNFTAHFQWRGDGEMPVSERARLRDIVARTHAEGKQLRFWATPDIPAMWQVLHAAGADWINTDRLAELSAFLSDASGAAAAERCP